MVYREQQFWSFMKQFTNDFHSWLQCLWNWLLNHFLPKIIIHNEPCIILSIFHMCVYENNEKNMETITKKKKRMETIDKLIGNKSLPFHLTLPCPDLSCLDVKVTGWPNPKLGSYLATMD